MRASRLAGLLAPLALATPCLASAHPMGNFSISHHARSTSRPTACGLRYVLDLAEIPTFQILQAEGLTADAETPAAGRICPRRGDARGRTRSSSSTGGGSRSGGRGPS